MFLHGKVLEDENNIIYSYDVSPKFSDLTYEDYANDGELKFIEVMTAYELDTLNLNEDMQYYNVIAEEKFDGHRALMFITSKGNRFFSRNVSKKTRWLTENSDLLPHIRDCDFEKYQGTVLDGELVLNINGEVNSCTVQTVLGSLPERALEMQLKYGFVTYYVFDILYYKGVKIQNMPLYRRKYYLKKVIKDLQHPYIKFVPFYTVDKKWIDVFFGGIYTDNEIIEVDDYYKLFQEFIMQGKEGLILKDIYGKYENKRSKNFLKMKGKTTWDVVITGFTEPEVYYYGKGEGEWDYWITKDGEIKIETHKFDEVKDMKPVTKYFALDWIGSIKFGVYKDGELIEIGECSGLTEELREEISRNRESYIGKTIEVLGQGIIDKEKGTIRHPRFYRFSTKNPEDCTFENLVNIYIYNFD